MVDVTCRRLQRISMLLVCDIRFLFQRLHQSTADRTDQQRQHQRSLHVRTLFYTAQRYTTAIHMALCLCVCLSQAGVLRKYLTFFDQIALFANPAIIIFDSLLYPSVDHSRALRASVGPLSRNGNRRLRPPLHTWFRTVESDLAQMNTVVERRIVAHRRRRRPRGHVTALDQSRLMQQKCHKPTTSNC